MTTDTTFTQRLAVLLNLPQDAKEADILAALKDTLLDEAKPDPKKSVPIEALQEALLDRGHKPRNHA